MTHAFEAAIEHIEQTIGYTFQDKGLLMQAFTRTSFCNEQSAREAVRRQSNEVLEFFGDSLLSAVIASLLIRDHTERYQYGIRTDLAEGELSSIKSRLSDKKNLSRSIQKLGLQDHLCMGEGDTKLGVAQQPSVMEDLFESILGAVYIDCGMHMEPVIQVVRAMLDVSEYLHPSSGTVLQNDKNLLQEFCADKRRRLGAPVYEDVSEEGPEHDRLYTRACRLQDTVWGVGTGKNRKSADIAAARDALAHLRSAEASGQLKLQRTDDDILRRLGELAAKGHLGTPDYVDLGKADDGILFHAACRLSGRTTQGTGTSKREAKRMAAERMLRQLTKK